MDTLSSLNRGFPAPRGPPRPPRRLSPAAEADLRQWQENAERLPIAENRQRLDALVAKHPDAYEIQIRRLSFYGSMLREERPATRAALLQKAAENGNDPLALTLAGAALYRYNTPRAIELLMAARAVAPDFPWSTLKLAEIYHAGRFQDLEKARTFFRTYANLCGGDISHTADWLISRIATPADQAEIARHGKTPPCASRSPGMSNTCSCPSPPGLPTPPHSRSSSCSPSGVGGRCARNR